MIDQSTTANAATAQRLLRLPEVSPITGLSRSTIYAMIRAEGFPAHRKIKVSIVAWSPAEV